MEIQRPRLSSLDLRNSLVSTLRKLCAGERSVTHVCNETGINRQQFAKYLDGRSMPSFENAMRIADYFDVACEELFGFRTVGDVVGFEYVPVVDKDSLAYKAKSAIEAIEKRWQSANFPVVGYYHFCSEPNGGKVKTEQSFERSLMRIERVGSEIFIEKRQYQHNQLGVIRQKVRYLGMGSIIDGLLNVRYFDPTTNNQLSNLVVQRFCNQHNDLTGKLLGRSIGDEVEIYAISVYLKYLGEAPDLRAAISQCGVFHYDEGHAAKEIENFLKPKA